MVGWKSLFTLEAHRKCPVGLEHRGGGGGGGEGSLQQGRRAPTRADVAGLQRRRLRGAGGKTTGAVSYPSP